MYQPKVRSQESTETLHKCFLLFLPVQALQGNPGRLQNNKPLSPEARYLAYKRGKEERHEDARVCEQSGLTKRVESHEFS